MINVFGSHMTKKEKQLVCSVLDSNWIGLGKQVELFENKFKKRLNLKNFLMLDSGSNALFMAIKLLNLPKNSEIIVPSFTWVSCAQCVKFFNHKVVFCDVDINTQNVTAEHIEKNINKNTKAIMVVHYAGLPCNMNEILSLRIPVIEDAAHAVNSKLNDIYCGNFGKISIFSFDSVKNLATPEGGGITCSEENLIEKAKKLRYCGVESSGFQNSSKKQNRWWEYELYDFYFKCLPNNISASIGLAQLERLNKLQTKRKEIWEAYKNNLKDLNWIKLPIDPDSTQQHSYFTYLIRVPIYERDKIANYLKNNGVYTTLRYHPLHMNKIYKNTQKLKNCEELSETALNIPLHPKLSKNDIDKIITLLRNYKI